MPLVVRTAPTGQTDLQRAWGTGATDQTVGKSTGRLARREALFHRGSGQALRLEDTLEGAPNKSHIGRILRMMIGLSLCGRRCPGGGSPRGLLGSDTRA